MNNWQDFKMKIIVSIASAILALAFVAYISHNPSVATTRVGAANIASGLQEALCESNSEVFSGEELLKLRPEERALFLVKRLVDRQLWPQMHLNFLEAHRDQTVFLVFMEEHREPVVLVITNDGSSYIDVDSNDEGRWLLN